LYSGFCRLNRFDNLRVASPRCQNFPNSVCRDLEAGLGGFRWLFRVYDVERNTMSAPAGAMSSA
jgi:hypothetical protein